MHLTHFGFLPIFSFLFFTFLGILVLRFSRFISFTNFFRSCHTA
jgi:hypothetical protein